MKFVSFFTGIGGIDRGFELAGMECVAQVENDAACRKVLQAHWPQIQRLGDIEDLYTDSIPKADLYCGGFPCQDLSVAGRRAGLNGSRSGLFFEFCRFVEAHAPQWIVVENVPGLLSSHKGRDMGTLVGTLEELGYGVAWRVLDLRYFGVPQRRRRLFFVGCRGSLRSSGEVLLEPASLRRNPPKSARKKKIVAATNGGGSGSRGWSSNTERMTFLPVSAASLEADAPGHRRRYEEGHILIAPTLMSKAQRNDPDHEDFMVGVSENQRAEVIESPVMRALTVAQGKMAPKVRIGLRVRRLMPVECERLQGFPDNWTDMLADSHRYKTLGNAVGVPVAHWLGIRIQAAEIRRRDRVAARKRAKDE